MRVSGAVCLEAKLDSPGSGIAAPRDAPPFDRWVARSVFLFAVRIDRCRPFFLFR